MGNNSGKFGVKEVPSNANDEMKVFDNLPKDIRDIVNKSPYKICCKEIVEMNMLYANSLLEGIELGNKLNAMAAYGPDHPQAQ